MKVLLIFALICCVFQHAVCSIIRYEEGKTGRTDRLLFNGYITKEGLFRFPKFGETELFNITRISIEDNAAYLAELIHVGGGVGHSYVEYEMYEQTFSSVSMFFYITGHYKGCNE